MARATRAVVSEPDTGSRLLVDQEDPVGVAVEGQSDIGPVLDDGLLQVHQVLRLDRIGRMVGEGPVELGEEEDHVEGQAVEDLGDDQPSHPVGRVGHDPQRPEGGGVDERPDMAGVLGQVVPSFVTARLVAVVDAGTERFLGRRRGSRSGRVS